MFYIQFDIQKQSKHAEANVRAVEFPHTHLMGSMSFLWSRSSINISKAKLFGMILISLDMKLWYSKKTMSNNFLRSIDSFEIRKYEVRMSHYGDTDTLSLTYF